MNVIWASESEIENHRNCLLVRNNAALSIKGTRSFHSFKPVKGKGNGYYIEARVTSSSVSSQRFKVADASTNL